jgi:hypothetical protein
VTNTSPPALDDEHELVSGVLEHLRDCAWLVDGQCGSSDVAASEGFSVMISLPSDGDR